RETFKPSPATFVPEFGLVNSHIVLGTRPEYVPMVTTTPFRDQVVTLQAIPHQEDDPNLILLCPVHVPRIYLERSHFRRSGQLLSVMEDSGRGRLSSNKDLPLACGCDPYGLPGQRLALPTGSENPLDHRHRCLGSSGKWASLTDIYRAAGWGTPNTLANLRMEPVPARVLNASS
ncbi:hypothetical protein M9458_008632, partial [Cirrhinus mrigala]